MRRSYKDVSALILPLGFFALTSACANETEYMAKYCGSTEVAFYVKEDLTTHYIPLYDAEISTDVPNVESGLLVKKEHEDYFEYKGSMNFVALKNPQSGYHVPGYEIEFGNEFYSVESRLPNGDARRYYINLQGSLYRIDQILYPVKGETITLTSRLCGGDFRVI